MQTNGIAMESAACDAPAKVNLSLEILGRRPDGYHELRSVVMPVSLFETVEVRARADAEVRVETVAEDGVSLAALDGLPPEKHLAAKAVRAMQRALDRPDRGADVRIVKRVPIGAGMAGGSADAAGTLACLRAMWAPDMPEADWLAVGASVGSDVPALMLGGAVLMEGRGERVSRLLAPDEHPAPFWLVVVFPDYSVSTKEAYALWDRTELANAAEGGFEPGTGARGAPFEPSNAGEAGKPPLTKGGDLCQNLARSVRHGDARAASGRLFNGLQNTVSRLHPPTSRFCLALRAAGVLGTLLSGSGSAVFGLAGSEKEAHEVRRRLPPGMRSRVVKTMPDGVMAAHGPLVP